MSVGANLLSRNLPTGRLLGRRLFMRICVCFVGLKLFYIVERMGLTSHVWGMIVLFLDDIRVI